MAYYFVDRRLNPKDKSLGNRRRFLKRIRSQVKKAVDEAISSRRIGDVANGQGVVVPREGVSEPSFQRSGKGGQREQVFTGNKAFRTGDQIEKPGGGGAGGGKEGSSSGEGEDEFSFVLSREEFLDIFFDDLELPDLIKRSLKEINTVRPRRAGLAVTGSPVNLNVQRTMRNAFGRRLGLKRPRSDEIERLRQEIQALEQSAADPGENAEELAQLKARLDKGLRRQRAIPYIDPLDVRYNHFVQQPEPNAKAVMFCLMDVSASMGEREKDLAKRFFMLLHLFLSRRYDRTELVFVRHTQEASEVDEETFFHSRQTGGTVVSSALIEMKKIVEARYSPSEWNIYAAQASDGENFGGDSAVCASILSEELMRMCQYFAYVEIIEEEEALLINNETSGMELWRAYRQVASDWPNFAMKRIAQPSDIYPVFRELFARKNAGADNG